VSRKRAVLVVDDNVALAENIGEILCEEGFDAQVANSGTEALDRLTSGTFDLVITDMRMPGMDGLEVLRAIKRQWPVLPVVVVTAFSREQRIHDALADGAVDVLPKPVDLDALLAVVGRVG
jgi:CheY-like chemotaxis protein